MFKVNIQYSGELGDLTIKTELPIIPRIGESIGLWHGDEWIVSTITSIIHELKENNKYLITEINVTDEYN